MTIFYYRYIYVDFDVVSHAKLFTRLRLHSYGIRDSVLLWLNFCGREMCTKVGLELSDVAELVSGIVRGSGLGPTMFLAYILTNLLLFFVNTEFLCTYLLTTSSYT